jgi:ligand-binding sensor domain-containing protein
MMFFTFSTAILLASAMAAGVSAAPTYYDNWETFSTADGLPSDKVMCVMATEENVWVGTDRGLVRYSDGRWTTYTQEDGLAHDAVMALAADVETGDLWIATMGGMNRYSAGRFDTYNQFNSGLANNVVYGVAAHRGEIWAATAAGTSRYEIAADRWSIYDETNTSMHEIWCYSVTGWKDNIYVAVWGGGLLEYQLERDRWKSYRDPDNEMEIDLFRDDGLVHDVVASVTVDDKNRVWVGTYFGLSSYDGRKWRNFMDHDSPLISNFINFVKAHHGFCWIGTDNGLNASDRETWWSYRIDPDSGKGLVTWHSRDGAEERLTTETIFPHNYILGICFQGDDIWVATEKGVARGKLSTTKAGEPGTPGTR